VTDLRRRRGSRRDRDPEETPESELIEALRRRSWWWLQGSRTSAPSEATPAPSEATSAPSEATSAPSEATSAPSEATSAPSEAEAPTRRRRARRAPPIDGITALRRGAWTWLRPAQAAAPEVEAPGKRRRARRDAAPEGVVELRRKAWAWFAPKATGESAAGTHAPAKAPAPMEAVPGGEVVRSHLKGVLEALIFASDGPLPARELARLARADLKVVKTLLGELVEEYRARGFRLDEVAGGYVFRTSPLFAPFVREQVAKKPVRMTRAQIETLAIVAYRQPITRPEIDDVRGVDSGAVLKSLLERELVRILGKKDEPGRPMLYGTTGSFLEFFGLKALGDLPTLREFTELTDESKRAYEREMGEDPPDGGGDVGLMGGEGELRTAPVQRDGEGPAEGKETPEDEPGEGGQAAPDERPEAREDELAEAGERERGDAGAREEEEEREEEAPVSGEARREAPVGEEEEAAEDKEDADEEEDEDDEDDDDEDDDEDDDDDDDEDDDDDDDDEEDDDDA